MMLLPADLPRPPEAQGKVADMTNMIAALRVGDSQRLSRLSDEAWLARLETIGVDINGLLARYAAALLDDVEGAKWLGASSSTSRDDSHRSGRGQEGQGL